MRLNIFRFIRQFNDEDQHYVSQVKVMMNRDNSYRGIFIMAIGVILELFLVLFHDIPILRSDTPTPFIEHYFVTHSLLLLVFLVGGITSYTYFKTTDKERYVDRFERIIIVVVGFILSLIAYINVLDLYDSDSLTVYVGFMLLIALFVKVHPTKVIGVIVLSFIVFYIASLVLYEDTVLYSIYINGMMIMITSCFVAYVTYNTSFHYHVLTIRLEEKTIELHNLATYDQLTQVYNRRKFDENLALELSRSKRTGDPFCLLMIDIDFFKKVNDQFGHQVGDHILSELALSINQGIRINDTFARYGGEEFVLILVNSSIQEAVEIAERIRENTKNKAFDDEIRITLSIGVTMYKEDDNSDSIIKRADNALYEAKEKGRNNVQKI